MEISPVSGSVDATRLQQVRDTRDAQAASAVRQDEEKSRAVQQSRVNEVQQPTTNLEGQKIGTIINTKA